MALKAHTKAGSSVVEGLTVTGFNVVHGIFDGFAVLDDVDVLYGLLGFCAALAAAASHIRIFA